MPPIRLAMAGEGSAPCYVAFDTDVFRVLFSLILRVGPATIPPFSGVPATPSALLDSLDDLNDRSDCLRGHVEALTRNRPGGQSSGAVLPVRASIRACFEDCAGRWIHS